jgi:hypothetical protein
MATLASWCRTSTTPSACRHAALPRIFLRRAGRPFDATMQDEAWALLAEALPHRSEVELNQLLTGRLWRAHL